MRSNAADAGASVVACAATGLSSNSVLALLVVDEPTAAKNLATQRARFAAWDGTLSCALVTCHIITREVA